MSLLASRSTPCSTSGRLAFVSSSTSEPRVLKAPAMSVASLTGPSGVPRAVYAPLPTTRAARRSVCWADTPCASAGRATKKHGTTAPIPGRTMATYRRHVLRLGAVYRPEGPRSMGEPRRAPGTDLDCACVRADVGKTPCLRTEQPSSSSRSEPRRPVVPRRSRRRSGPRTPPRNNPSRGGPASSDRSRSAGRSPREGLGPLRLPAAFFLPRVGISGRLLHNYVD
jgi:hypothetical protein